MLRTRATENAEVRGAMIVRSAVICVAIAMGMLPAAAHASVAIESFSNLPSSPEAGQHPNILTTFTLSSHQTAFTSCGCDDTKDATAHLPTGLIGNPHATPQCDIAEFAAEECPVDSQVGVAWPAIAAFPGVKAFENQTFLSPVYNLIPPPKPARPPWLQERWHIRHPHLRGHQRPHQQRLRP